MRHVGIQRRGVSLRSAVLHTVGHRDAILDDIDTATVLGLVVNDEAAGHQTLVHQGQGATIGCRIVLQYTITHVREVGHDSGATVLVDVHLRGGRTIVLAIGLTTHQEEAIQHSTVGDVQVRQVGKVRLLVRSTCIIRTQ